MIPEIYEELDSRNGIWKVVAGIDGKTEEFTFDINVNVKGIKYVVYVKLSYLMGNFLNVVEKLDHAVTTDNNKIHLKCNLINSKKIITFCRFLRLADDVGFNMDEGVGSVGYR